MAAKAAPPKAEIDELLDERERQQRVDALVGRVRRDPTLLTSYTWKWRTSVAATHVLLGLVVYHALTRVIVAEARGMIDTIDVHALGLGDGDGGRTPGGSTSSRARKPPPGPPYSPSSSSRS